MRLTTLRCSLRTSRLCLLLSVALHFTAPLSAAGQENVTVPGCYSCPEGYYNHLDRGCQPCTKCVGSLVAASPCGSGDPEYCDIVGQLDTVCCEEYEYIAYGECVLDCRRCEVTGRCKEGLTECDCPPNRYGTLCEFIEPTTQAPAPPQPPTATKTTHSTESTERSIPLEAWHFAIIALCIVVGVVGFAALCVLGSFCQYSRRALQRGTKFTVTSTVFDSRSSSTVTMSSNSSNDSMRYLISPPHTRICSTQQCVYPAWRISINSFETFKCACVCVCVSPSQEFTCKHWNVPPLCLWFLLPSPPLPPLPTTDFLPSCVMSVHLSFCTFYF